MSVMSYTAAPSGFSPKPNPNDRLSDSEIFAQMLLQAEAAPAPQMSLDIAAMKAAINKELDRFQIEGMGAMLDSYRDHITKIRAYLRSDKKNKQLIRKVDAVFAAGDQGQMMGILFDAKLAKARLATEPDIKKIQDCYDAIVGKKVLHQNQMRTMADSLFAMLLTGKSGVIIGAVQSGKTGIGMAHILVLAPLYYLMTGKTLLPVFVSTNILSHKEQSQQELNALLLLYGDVEIKVASLPANGGVNIMEYFEQFRKMLSEDRQNNSILPPTISNFRARVEGVAHDVFQIIARTAGKNTKYIRQLIRLSEANNFGLLMVMDEPQYGASGPVTAMSVENPHDPIKGAIINQWLDEFHQMVLEAGSRHFMIGLSATPFGMTIKNMFKVYAHLAEGYVGFNMFGGRRIDPKVPIVVPAIYTWERLCLPVERPDLDPVLASKLRRRMRDAAPILNEAEAQFRLWENADKANKPHVKRGGVGILGADALPYLFCQHGAAMSMAFETRTAGIIERLFPESSMSERVTLMRRIAARRLYKVFMAMVSEPALAHLYGAMIRIVNDNNYTTEIVKDARLGDYFDLVRFYDNAKDNFVRTLMDNRTQKHKPALVLVTNKARMGDAFGREIELYMDFVSAPNDMNAALQGVVGRSAGTGKVNSKIIIMTGYAHMVSDYVESYGSQYAKGGRHSIGGSDGKASTRQFLRTGFDGETGKDPFIRKQLDLLTKLTGLDLITEQYVDGIDKKGNAIKLLNNKGGVKRLPERAFRKIIGDIQDYVQEQQEALLANVTEIGFVNFGGEIVVNLHDSETSTKLRWDSNDDGVKVNYRYMTPEMAAAMGRTFEAVDRANLESRESRKDTTMIRLRRGMSPEIDLFMDEVSNRYGSDISLNADKGLYEITTRNQRKTDIMNLFADLKPYLETNHATLWPNTFGAINIPMPGDNTFKIKRGDDANSFTDYDIFPDGDVGYQLRWRPQDVEGENTSRTDNVLGNDKFIRPQFNYDRDTGEIFLLCFPVIETERMDERPATFNIQINVRWSDAKGHFEAAIINLPMSKQMTFSKALREYPKPDHFLNTIVTEDEDADRTAIIIKKSRRGKPQPTQAQNASQTPIKPAPKATKGRRATVAPVVSPRPRSRSTAATAGLNMNELKGAAK